MTATLDEVIKELQQRSDAQQSNGCALMNSESLDNTPYNRGECFGKMKAYAKTVEILESLRPKFEEERTLSWYYDDDSGWGFIIDMNGVGTTLGYEGSLEEATVYFGELAQSLNLNAKFIEEDTNEQDK
jgi:tetratricopeptide (TPR) repeat protein